MRQPRRPFSELQGAPLCGIKVSFAAPNDGILVRAKDSDSSMVACNGTWDLRNFACSVSGPVRVKPPNLLRQPELGDPSRDGETKPSEARFSPLQERQWISKEIARH